MHNLSKSFLAIEESSAKYLSYTGLVFSTNLILIGIPCSALLKPLLILHFSISIGIFSEPVKKKEELNKFFKKPFFLRLTFFCCFHFLFVF